MADYGFGEELAAARRRNGYSIQQVSDAIRIRPDILRAIEMGDFARMPAKGFARNQVSAYARYLGLDSADITQRFLSAYADFERSSMMIGYVTDYQQPSNDRAYVTAMRAQRMRDEAQAHPSSGRSHNRRTYGEGNRQRNRRDPLDGAYETTAQRRANDATRDDGRRRYAAPRRSGHRTSAGDNGIGSRGFRPGGVPFWRSRRFLLVVVAVVVIVIIAVAATRCGGDSSSSGVPQVSGSQTTQTQGTGTTTGDNAIPVTGGASSNTTVMPNDSSNALTAMPDVKIQATSFKLTITIPEGSSTWVQVDADGSTPIAEVVDGPRDLDFTVTQSASLQIGNSAAATVKVDGNDVPLKVDEDGLGTLTLTLKDGQVASS